MKLDLETINIYEIICKEVGSRPKFEDEYLIWNFMSKIGKDDNYIRLEKENDEFLITIFGNSKSQSKINIIGHCVFNDIKYILKKDK